ncbi:MAG: hypothetical protein EA419_09510 [Wenzhouxiangella sp.]|nr:MAG: hypothetical protein EA419_09510 [Wenzhouxiangella sp.]
MFALAIPAILLLVVGCGTTPPPPPEPEHAPTGHFADSANLRYSNKWRIEVSEGARSTGEIVFHLTPFGGETQVIAVPIERGTGENRVAREIRDVFRDSIDPGSFTVEVDDGEDVLVKKRRDAENFALSAVSSTVGSVRLRVQAE